MITIVHNDQGDWVGIYDGATGRLVKEAHSFDPSEVLEAASIPHAVVWNVVMPESHLPPTLGELAALGGFVRTHQP